MKPVTATLVACLGFLASACSVEQTPTPFAQGSLVAAPEVAFQLAEAGPTDEPRAADAPTRAGTAEPLSGNGVRDAKEATEDAARRIADATLHAANKLREVGASAINALRDPDPDSDVVLEAGADDAGETEAELAGG